MYPPEQQQRLQHLTWDLLRAINTTISYESTKQLRDAIRYHDWRYYVLSEPVVTDFEYDALFKKLKEAEAKHPEWITPDSPTQRVAAGLSEDFPPVNHLVSMLSLENSYSTADLLEFDRKVKDLTNSATIEYCVEPKFDGSSIALVYENDRLTRAATRGDGTMGEDITNNARALNSIPLVARFSAYKMTKVELRGEVIIRKDVFARMNAERKLKGEKEFQNPRNTASGSLRMKDPRESAARGLEAVLYHVSYAVDEVGNTLVGEALKTHFNAIEMIHNCGFKSPIQEIKKCKDIEEVIAFIEEWDTKRHTFPIETDGMVVKVNDLQFQLKCGSTAHHPRWAMAYKFAAKQATSKLIAVEYQVGRTGAVTPVAKIEPVALSGVTISSISLHNEDFIREKDIRIGDTVLVERAGEVIPYIIGSVADLRNGSEQEIVYPTHCPSCNSLLVRPEEEAVWRCDNAECPAQIEERIIHFVSKDAMDIDAMGGKTVIDFIERGFLKNPEGIYQLPFEQIKALEGWGEKSVEKLIKGIEESKRRPLWRLLTGLGIRHVGVTTAKDLAVHVQSIFDFPNYSMEALTNIEGIGPKVAQSIFNFFQQAGNIHLLEKLKEFGINTDNRPEDSLAKNNKLEGKTFLFTGTLTQFSRDQAKQMVEENGGKLLSGVSANLNFLVAGADAGSKLSKAQKIPSIQIISEQEFLSLLTA